MPSDPLISIRDLRFSFPGSEKPALDGVSVDIDAGEFVVFTGASGCGKSTLALAIAGVLFNQYHGSVEGDITVAGIDARHCAVYDLAETVGLVQQNPETQFCTLTVLDELAFGLENRQLPVPEIEARISWALDVVGGAYLRHRDLATLSGGEKQKVAIAAMMAAQPRVLIFDEPTSNLDPQATEDIFKVISRIRETDGITVIVIEHKLDYLHAYAPRLFHMENGKIVETSRLDSPPALLSIPEKSPLKAIGDAVLVIDNLHLSLDNHPILRGVNLSVHRGELVTIMGNNGAGKSTLMLAAMGLLKADQGTVHIAGKDTRTTNVSEIAWQVGFVFQNPDHQLFTQSVWDEASFAAENFGRLDEGVQQDLHTMLARAGLGDRLEAHPYRLSYGEKRRLNLIAVMSSKPALLLLDEILIGQDKENITWLMGMLRQYTNQGGAVVMINHHPHIAARYADRLVFLDDGSKLVDAPPYAAFQQLKQLGYSAYGRGLQQAARQPSERIICAAEVR